MANRLTTFLDYMKLHPYTTRQAIIDGCEKTMWWTTRGEIRENFEECERLEYVVQLNETDAFDLPLYKLAEGG